MPNIVSVYLNSNVEALGSLHNNNYQYTGMTAIWPNDNATGYNAVAVENNDGFNFNPIGTLFDFTFTSGDINQLSVQDSVDVSSLSAFGPDLSNVSYYPQVSVHWMTNGEITNNGDYVAIWEDAGNIKAINITQSGSDYIPDGNSYDVTLDFMATKQMLFSAAHYGSIDLTTYITPVGTSGAQDFSSVTVVNDMYLSGTNIQMNDDNYAIWEENGVMKAMLVNYDGANTGTYNAPADGQPFTVTLTNPGTYNFAYFSSTYADTETVDLSGVKALANSGTPGAPVGSVDLANVNVYWNNDLSGSTDLPDNSRYSAVWEDGNDIMAISVTGTVGAYTVDGAATPFKLNLNHPETFNLSDFSSSTNGTVDLSGIITLANTGSQADTIYYTGGHEGPYAVQGSEVVGYAQAHVTSEGGSSYGDPSFNNDDINFINLSYSETMPDPSIPLDAGAQDDIVAGGVGGYTVNGGSGFDMFLASPASLANEGNDNFTGVYVELSLASITYQSGAIDIAENFEYFMGTTGDDIFIGSSGYASQYDIQTFNGSGGNDEIFGAETTYDTFTSVETDIKTAVDYSSMQGGQGAVFILDGSTVMSGMDGNGDLLYAEIKTAAGDNWNGWRPYDEGTFGAGEKISTVSRYDEDKEGASVILDTFGDIDLAFNVDHYIGSSEADIFFGSNEDDIFDAASGSGNFMSGGAGTDTLIVSDMNDGEDDNLDLSSMEIGRAYTYGNYQSVSIDANGEIISDAEDATTYSNLYRIDFAQVNDLYAFIDGKISSNFTPTSTVTSDYELFIRTNLDTAGITAAGFYLDSANQKIDVTSGTDLTALSSLAGQLVLGEEQGLDQYVIQGKDYNGDDYSTIIDSVEHVILTDNSLEYLGTGELTGTELNPHYGHEYELITGGQGDLGDMLYVTTDQVLKNTTLTGPDSSLISGDVYYSGNHKDFVRHDNPLNWAAQAQAANASGVWNNEVAQFFVWYDSDGEGGEDGYEIAVKYENGDVDGWTIDNRRFDTFANVHVGDIMAEAIKSKFEDVSSVATGEYRILYEAGFSDIEEIIGSNADVENWNFDFTPSSARSTFYIQVGGDTTGDNGSAGVVNTTNVKVEFDAENDMWVVNPDAEILVNLRPVDGTTAADVVIGGNAAENIVGNLGSDVMMGRGGSDNYLIASGDTLEGILGVHGVDGDIINEIGGSSEDKSDSITLSDASNIDQLTFTRTEIKNEYYTNTLKIDVDYDAKGEEGYGVIDDTIYVFDHYNQDLGFRAVEQLLLDDGWGSDDMWNLVVGDTSIKTDYDTDGVGTPYECDEYIGKTGHDILMAGVAETSILYGGNGQDIMIGDDLSGYTDDGNFTRKTIFELGARGTETDAWDQVADIIQGFGTGDELDLSNLGIYDSADLRKDVSALGNDELYAIVNTVEVKIAEFRDFKNELGIDDVLNSITTPDVV